MDTLQSLPGGPADATLDVTRDICPMTFVRTRLALDRLSAGQVLLVLLRGAEAQRNVPRSVREHGHKILGEQIGEDGVMRLLLERG